MTSLIPLLDQAEVRSFVGRPKVRRDVREPTRGQRHEGYAKAQTASFETSLLDLLHAGPDGLFIQLHHQHHGSGRYEMTARMALV